MNFLTCGDIGKDFALVPYSYSGVITTAFYAQYSGITHGWWIVSAFLYLIFESVEKAAVKITQVYTQVFTVSAFMCRSDGYIVAQQGCADLPCQPRCSVP
jgi:hypothetical protein